MVILCSMATNFIEILGETTVALVDLNICLLPKQAALVTLALQCFRHVKQKHWHSCQGRHWHHPAGIEVLASTRSVSADDNEMDSWIVGIFGPDHAQFFIFEEHACFSEAFKGKVR